MGFVPRKSLPHEVPKWVKSGELYFFTLCVHEREKANLLIAEVAKVILAAAEHYHLSQQWHVRLFLLMPDHLHALISFPADESIQECWRSWKRYTAKQTGVVWQRNVFEHRIRSAESGEVKANYIRENPVRKGLVADTKLWPWVFEP